MKPKHLVLIPVIEQLDRVLNAAVFFVDTLKIFVKGQFDAVHERPTEAALFVDKMDLGRRRVGILTPLGLE